MNHLASALKILLFNVALHLVLKWSGLNMDGPRVTVVQALGFWGSVMFFGARHLLGAGFFTGLHGTRSWVGTATPAFVWHLAGVLLWAIAGLCFCLMA